LKVIDHWEAFEPLFITALIFKPWMIYVIRFPSTFD